MREDPLTPLASKLAIAGTGAPHRAYPGPKFQHSLLKTAFANESSRPVT